jgi:xanthine phosphoribosyltransferase
MQNRYYYSFEEFMGDLEKLSKKIIGSGFYPDTIVAIARGGLTFSHFLGEVLDVRNVVSINSIHYEDEQKLDFIKLFNVPDLSSSKKVLVVDDISDSGDTLEEVLKLLKSRYPDVEIKVATIFYKPTSKIIPDFKLKEANEWVQFFWEKML